MDEADQYWRPASASMPSSKQWERPTTTSQAQADLNRSTWINQCAQMVFGSYRKDDFSDPDSYRVQLGMVLERYPDEIIREATNPTTGIQRACKWPPSIAEVVEFCDSLKRRAGFSERWEKQSNKQLEERKQMQLQRDEEPLEHRQKVAERILAEFRARVGLDKKLQIETPETAKVKFGMTDEEWDVVPDQTGDFWKTLPMPKFS